MTYYNKILHKLYELYIKESNAMCIGDGSAVYTWKEFWKFVSAFVKIYNKHKLSSQDIVIIKLDNGVEALASIVACMVLNLIYVPLGSFLPANVYDYIQEITKSKLVVDKNVSNEAMKYYQEDNCVIIKENDFVECRKDDLNTIVFTSGSTGNPKGVMISHEDLWNAVIWIVPHTLEKTSSKITLSILPYSFVFSLQCIFHDMIIPELKRYILSRDYLMDINKMQKFIKDKHIERMAITPNILEQIDFKKTDVDTVYVGGGNFLNVYKEELENIFVGYGMTETCGGIVFTRINEVINEMGIGNEWSSNTIYLLDEKGNESNYGEIFVVDPNSRGYYQMEEATKKYYRKNPFYKQDGKEIIFATGDYAKRSDDGSIIFIGRKDDMIKVHDQRVELGEVEHSIKTITNVSEAVVKSFKDSDGNNYLVAYFTTVDGHCDIQKIRKNLVNIVPIYMVPRFFIHVDKFVLNKSGKIDKKVLKEPSYESQRAEYVAPTTKLQQEICVAFEKVFETDQIGINDDFIVLGGDSVRAIELTGELSSYNISVSDIVRLKTPKNIEKEIISNKEIQSIDFSKYKKQL